MAGNKTQTAAILGIDLTPPAHLPVAGRNAPSEIGREIVRRAAYGRVNVESITKYLVALEECGIIVRAALAANLSYSSILTLRTKDPEFAAEEEAAKQRWIATKIDDPLYKIGIEGVHRMILDPKNGVLLQGEKVIQPQIALAYARKFDKAYREKQELDVNHSGGVVVVTAPTMTPEEWNARAASRNQQKREMIDGVGTPKLPSGD